MNSLIDPDLASHADGEHPISVIFLARMIRGADSGKTLH